MHRVLLAASALLCSIFLTTAADDAPTQQEQTRVRLALVLSGGGARGAAHVGVLKVLEELNIQPDLVVGTSMGSIVGGLYAAGMSPAELEETFARIDWEGMFLDRPPRQRRYWRRKEDDVDLLIPFKLRLKDGKGKLPIGLIPAQRLENTLKLEELATSASHDFDRLPIRFRAVTTDLATGDPVVLDHGSLATAMRASMAVPGVFPPVVLDGKMLVDGGPAANLPIGIALAMGAEKIIAVDISTPLEGRPEPHSYTDVVKRLSGFLTKGNVKRDIAQLRADDFLLVPELDQITAASFDKVMTAIDLGESAARGSLLELRRYSSPAGTFDAWKTSHRHPTTTDQTIAKITLDNRSPLKDEVILAKVHQKAGEPLDPERLFLDLSDLYGLDYFEPIHFDAERLTHGIDIHLHLQERQTGLNTLQFGLDLETDFRGGSRFILGARHQKQAMNRKGAEWRNDFFLGAVGGIASEFYQPLDNRLRFFIAPGLFFEEEERIIGNTTGDEIVLRTESYGGRIRFGRNLGRWGMFDVALERRLLDVEVKFGEPTDVFQDLDIDEIRLGLEVDTFDSSLWPTSGLRGRILLENELDGLGGETDNRRVSLNLDGALKIGRSVLVPGISLSELYQGDLGEISSAFSAGGLLNLSGYEPGELVGDKGLVGRLVFYRQLDRKVLGLIKPGWYLGFSLEAGNVYPDFESITADSLLLGGSIFLGLKSMLGPAAVGYGYSEPDHHRIFLTLGRSLLRPRAELR